MRPDPLPGFDQGKGNRPLFPGAGAAGHGAGSEAEVQTKPKAAKTDIGRTSYASRGQVKRAKIGMRIFRPQTGVRAHGIFDAQTN